ncbi:hypothetical protein GXW76_02590 [Roseomonas soli]|uniref:Uncharacterized protein n=1 Tax=Neoroseomonas soli TaxID=1081025 RepID=A0A9X9WSC1_9PROT|nr:hypothetical protein [Neoroseomonas soli]
MDDDTEQEADGVGQQMVLPADDLPTRRSRTDRRHHRRPFGIRQVRRVTQAAAIRRASTFRRPFHPPAPRNDPAGKRITGDSIGSIAFRVSLRDGRCQ